jgi:hypothetical protein
MEPRHWWQLDFLEAGETYVRSAMLAAGIVLNSVYEDWRAINFLDNRPEDAAEDEEDRSKLVNAEEVLRELFAFRDEVLNRELPPILEGLWEVIERAWNNKKSAVVGWLTLLGRGELAPLYEHFRAVALQTSPRAFIGRMNQARRRAEHRLRKRHLFSRGERRWTRKIAQRV